MSCGANDVVALFSSKGLRATVKSTRVLALAASMIDLKLNAGVRAVENSTARSTALSSSEAAPAILTIKIHDPRDARGR
jgi:hypothetical protein